MPNSASVTVVIPTVGKPALAAAVESVLAQDYPVLEILVCLDAIDAPPLPADERLRVVRVGPGAGGNTARQKGIDEAKGTLVALLDDDDVWLPNKLSAQLALVDEDVSDDWLATSRVQAKFPDREEIWPSRLLSADETLPQYIFRKRTPIGGVGFVQASTLLFPTALGRKVPFDVTLRHHQDIDWLVRVSTAFPGLRVYQSPYPLTTYVIGGGKSVSSRITPEMSTKWAQSAIVDDPRSLGDFILTSGSLYAARAGSPTGVLRSALAGVRSGRPGWSAYVFAAGNLMRAFKWKFELARSSRV